MDEIERRSKLTLSLEDPVLVRFVLPDIEGSVVSAFPLIVRFRPLPSSDARSVGKRSMAIGWIGRNECSRDPGTFVRGCTSWWLAPPRRCPPPPLHTCGMGSTGNRKPSDKPAFIRARMIRQRDGQRCCWRWCCWCCCTPARSPRHVEAVD